VADAVENDSGEPVKAALREHREMRVRHRRPRSGEAGLRFENPVNNVGFLQIRSSIACCAIPRLVADSDSDRGGRRSGALLLHLRAEWLTAPKRQAITLQQVRLEPTSTRSVLRNAETSIAHVERYGE